MSKLIIPLIIGIIINFHTKNTFANECAVLFSERGTLQKDMFGLSESKNSGDVLLDIFSHILNAPNNSRIKIFTRSLNNDGISALLLLVSVQESRKERGLKFDFYLENNASVNRIHDLFVERSTNRVMFRDSSDENGFMGKTFMMIENEKTNTAEFYQFEGELNSVSLKNSQLKGPIPLKYEGRNILRASPFVNVNGVQLSSSKGLEALSDPYTINHVSKITMNDTDIILISDRAFDLALQLHHHRKGSPPKDESLSSLDILRSALK